MQLVQHRNTRHRYARHTIAVKGTAIEIIATTKKAVLIQVSVGKQEISL